MRNSKEPRRMSYSSQRMPKDSTFYDKVVPILIVGLSLVMLSILVVVVGVLLGVVSWH